jgi:predicted dehydrogenase
MSKDPIINIGIIGCGAVVQKYYAKVLPLISNVKIVRVCDINKTNSEKIAKEIRSRSGDLDEVISESNICIIATPPSSHYSIATKCLTGGRDVFCEKPFVGSMKEAKELTTLAERLGKKIYVGHFRRNYPNVNLAKKLISTGVFGPINAVTVTEGGRFSWNTSSGYTSKEKLGGVIYDTGSHAIDMAMYAVGLDDSDIQIVDVGVKKDQPEPSNLFKGSANIQLNGEIIKMKIFLSRYQTLANSVRINCRQGIVEFSTGMDGYVTVKGPTGRTVLCSTDRYTDALQCFRRQFDLIIEGKARCFEGHRFINLSALLESFSNQPNDEIICQELL